MTGHPSHLVHGMGLEAVEANWPPLTDAEVRTLLEPLAGEAAAAATVVWRSPRPFSAAALVTVAGDQLFVKRHHVAVRSLVMLAEEHAFQAHLHERGAAVARVLGAWQQGDLVYEVHEAMEGEDRYRDALSWTPWRSPAEATEGGRALARLHVAAEGFAAPRRDAGPLIASSAVVDSPDPVAAVEALVAGRPGLADFLAGRSWREQLTSRLEPFHRRYLPVAGTIPPLWTHNDWHPSNLLWSGERVAGVMDFGLCNRTGAAYDLAMALERGTIGWLEPADRRQVWPDLVEALIAGYVQVRALSPADRAALSRLLPLVHVDYALSEVDYFHSVVGSAANSALAYDDYLLGHLEWWQTADGEALCAEVEASVEQATVRFGHGGHP